MSEIEQGSRVIAVRQGNNHLKGAKGFVLAIQNIDSEMYLSVLLDAGIVIGPTLEDYWEVLETQGMFLRNYRHAEKRYEHVIYSMDDDRVECRDETGKLMVIFDAHCTAYLPDGTVVGRFTQDGKDHWLFRFDDPSEDLIGPSTRLVEGLLDFEVEVVKHYLSTRKTPVPETASENSKD